MIVITGGTGVMGTALVRRFVGAGESVRVLALAGDRGIGAAKSAGAQVVEGDVADDAQVRGLCDGARVVYHLAAVIIAFNDTVYRRVNVGGTEAVCAEAKRAGVEHLVHVSSASVVYPRTTAYSRSKRDAEQVVAASGVPHTIVRPTLVYDTGRGGQEFDDFLGYLRRFPVVPFIGGGSARKRPVHVDDVLAGLVALESHEGRGMVYNLSGGESITMFSFAKLCLGLMGMPGKPIVRLPVALCRLMAMVMERTMTRPPLRWPVIAGITQDADLDPASAARDLGYAPSRVTERLPGCFPRE